MKTAPAKKRGRPPKAATTEDVKPDPFAIAEEDQATPPEIESGFDIPPVCPLPTDPACGDKTPAVVQWWKDNYPAEYERRYANRVHPEPEDTVTRPAHLDAEDPTLEDESEPKKPNVIKN